MPRDPGQRLMPEGTEYALPGVWLILAGPVLSQKFSIADPMFWSNSWAGGVLIALAALGLTAVAMRRPARR